MGQQRVARTHHDASQSTPVPATCTGPKIECDTSVKFPIGMKAEQTTIIWMNQDSAMSFRYVKGELCHLLDGHTFGGTLNDIRYAWQQHMVRQSCVGCHHTNRTVNYQAWRKTRCEDNAQLANGRFGVQLLKLWYSPWYVSDETSVKLFLNERMNNIWVILGALPTIKAVLQRLVDSQPHTLW